MKYLGPESQAGLHLFAPVQPQIFSRESVGVEVLLIIHISRSPKAVDLGYASIRCPGSPASVAQSQSSLEAVLPF